MKTLLACIDNSAASRPVLAVANAVAPLLGATVDAVYVPEDGSRTARASAGAAAVPFRVVPGDPLEVLAALSASDDVVAVAIGARDLPGGSGHRGHLALALANQVAVPVLVVPPEARPPNVLHRVLIAMEGSPGKVRALKRTVDIVTAAGLELVVVHVDDVASIPNFSEQVQHETDVYAGEFLARHLPGSPPARLELRFGVPVDEILRAADTTQPDILAMGWPQTDDPARGVVARALVDRCHLPMMLVAIES